MKPVFIIATIDLLCEGILLKCLKQLSSDGVLRFVQSAKQSTDQVVEIHFSTNNDNVRYCDGVPQQIELDIVGTDMVPTKYHAVIPPSMPS